MLMNTIKIGPWRSLEIIDYSNILPGYKLEIEKKDIEKDGKVVAFYSTENTFNERFDNSVPKVAYCF